MCSKRDKLPQWCTSWKQKTFISLALWTAHKNLWTCWMWQAHWKIQYPSCQSIMLFNPHFNQSHKMSCSVITTQRRAQCFCRTTMPCSQTTQWMNLSLLCKFYRQWPFIFRREQCQQSIVSIFSVGMYYCGWCTARRHHFCFCIIYIYLKLSLCCCLENYCFNISYCSLCWIFKL